MSDRTIRINELLKQEVARFLLSELELPPDTMATITKVKTSPDLRDALVFLSVYPFVRSTQVIKAAQGAARQIQQLLNDELKMWSIPRLHFKLDVTEQTAVPIEEALEQIKKEI